MKTKPLATLSALCVLLTAAAAGAESGKKPDAIRGWVEEASRKYQPMFTLMRTSVQGDQVSLSAAVAGQFPGSPVTLDYELRLRGGKTSTLTIA